jgi:F0F1-type ATP synthase epsilon subunit
MAQPTQPQPQSQVQRPVQQPVSLSAEKFHLTVRNRTQVLFNEEVKSVSSKNDTGVFDILPEHSNFISLITSPLIIRKINGQKQEITFNNGLIKVKENNVHCYIDLISQGVGK